MTTTRDQSQTLINGHCHLKQNGHKGNRATLEKKKQQQRAATIRVMGVSGVSLKRRTTRITLTKGAIEPMEGNSMEQPNNNFRLVANLHALVKRIKKPNHHHNHHHQQHNHWARQLAFLLVAGLVLGTSLPNYQSIYLEAEAKIHHSKRQAPQANSATGSGNGNGGPSTLTGRESTNWWNVWWQQYINEAVQPTVRPIVSVSFNGRTINLSDQLNSDLASPTGNSIAQYQGDNMGDVDTNMVFSGNTNQNQFGVSNMDLERSSERLINQPSPLVAGAASVDQVDDNMDKQLLLSQKKTMQHQMHWQSVKPTIIQPTSSASSTYSTMRDSRTNRQVNEELASTSGDQASSNLGIQMRASMSNTRPQPPQPQLQTQPQTQQPIQGGKVNLGSRLPGFRASPAQNLFQQQWMQQQMQQAQVQIPMEDGGNRFEQQQNQMADYNEENEPDMEDANKTIDSSDDRSRTSTDSSSSSMMQEDRPSTGNQQATMMMPGMRKPVELASGANFGQGTKQGNGPRVIVMMGMGPQSVTSTSTTSQVLSTSRRQPIATTNGTVGDSGASSRDETDDNGSSRATQAATSTRSSVPSITATTAAATTTTTTPSPTVVPTTTMTTQSGQGGSKIVQLENGRPATGFRQQGTTNAARPPTLTTQAARAMFDQTTTVSSGSGSGSGSSETISTTQAPTTTTINPNVPSTTTSTGGSSQAATTTGSRLSGSSESEAAAATTTTTTTPQANPTSRAMLTTTEAPASNDRSPFETTTMRSATGPAARQTTTLRPMAATGGSETTTSPDAGGDESDEGDDDEEGGSGQQANGSNSTNLMNSSNDESSGDDEEEEDETTGSTAMAGQEQPTTTVATPLSKLTVTMGSSQASTGGGGQPLQTRQQQSSQSPATTTTTQQPSMTTIDIERLPKGSTTNMRATSLVQSTTPTSTTTTSGDIARIQLEGAGNKQQDNNANIIMMTIGQNNNNRRPTAEEEEEMAITMPMEALMKMMNQVVEDSKQRQQLPPIQFATNEMPFTTTTTLTTAATSVTTPTPTPTPTTPSTAPAMSTTFRPTTSQDREATTTQRPSGSSSRLPTTTMTTDSTQTENSRAPDQDQGSTIMTSTPVAPKRKLLPPPPPPTPRAEIGRQPIQMQTNFIESSSSSSSSMGPGKMMSSMATMGQDNTQSLPQDKTNMMPSLESESSVSPSDDEMISGGRGEPKIELINLDLMPIQRIMNNRSSSSSMDNQMMMMMMNRNLERERLTQQLADRNQFGPMFMNGSTRIPPTTTSNNEFKQTQPMEQVVIAAEVEPGMRLRPPSGGSSPFMMRQQQQSSSRTNGPIIMSDMLGNKNQANTVYMIMMNAPSSTTAGRTSLSQSPSSDDRQAPNFMTTKVMQRDQTRTTSLPPTTKTIPIPITTTTQMLDRITPTSNQMMMRTTKTTFTTPTSSGLGGSGSMASTRSPFTTSTTQQQQKQMMMVQLLKQEALPVTTTTTAPVVSTATTFMDNSVPDSSGGQQRQTEQTISKNDGSLGKTTMRSQQQQPASSQTFSQTGSNIAEPTTSTIGPDQSAATSTPKVDSMAPTTATTPTPSLRQTTTASGQGSRSSQDSGGPTGPSNESNRGKLQPMVGDRRPMMQQQQHNGATKSGKTTSGNNGTSSFIPQKLRQNFNRPEGQNQQQQASAKLSQQEPTNPTTQPTPLTGMAIRQFGGANRMSVLGNQPVPFGRPAAMTMQSATGPANRQASATGAASRQSNGRQFELPTFEYGPSISVRRPDEPLANGQIPNCTLTGKNFCVLTKDYPMNEVRQAVERSFRSVRIMYEELQTVSDQELHKDDFNATNNQAASGKFACQTQVEMMRPGWAKDEITKEWMLVVNTDVFPQRVRTESCAQPNTPCEFIAPFYDSTCQQRYSLHRMIAIDPHDPSRSPQVAVFKFPAGCVCRVHPIRKTTTTSMAATTPFPTTMMSSSTSKSVSRRR